MNVRLAQGEIAGTGEAVRVYRGIPYAAPPVGPLRWRPPEPPLPWSGIHDGSRFGADPMQLTHVLPVRRSLAPGVSEDCLFLNVWAPAETPPGGAPVAVWFDGGGYIAMCAKDLGADCTLAWPSAEIAVMGAEAAVEIVHHNELLDAVSAPARRQDLIEEYRETFYTPYVAAGYRLVDDIIEPAQTRGYLAEALDALSSKRDWRPAKKHGLIPL